MTSGAVGAGSSFRIRIACAKKVDVRLDGQNRRAWHASPPRMCMPMHLVLPGVLPPTPLPMRGQTGALRWSMAFRVASVMRLKKKLANWPASHAAPNVSKPGNPKLSGLRLLGSSNGRPSRMYAPQHEETLK